MFRRLSVFATLSLTAMGCNLQTNPLVVKLFGPPSHTLAEAYEGTGGTAEFDHTELDTLLARHVHGYRVDYAALERDEEALDRYIAALATAPFDDLSRDDKLAVLINAYNAFTLKLILDHYPLQSIQDIPSADRWDAERWVLGGRTVSLTHLEHDELRAKFVEPRIHFAINCASVGCPPLRAEAYVGERIDEQLRDQSQQMHDDALWLDVQGQTVQLTPLYLWYAGDFEQVGGDALGFASQFRPELGQGSYAIEWKEYDWSLNDVQR